jgi:hypothetical protein
MVRDERSEVDVKKRPEHLMSEVLVKDPTGPINKRFTSLKVAGEDADKGASAGGADGTFRPSDEQLERINQFTRTPKTADEVSVLRTMSANDIRDRDHDRFKTSCIKSFAGLPQPLSPVGKPYMVSHDTTKLPVGRIFGTGTKRVEDNLFLTNEVYIPNTDANKEFMDNVDYGVYWAVSVGVTLGAAECTVGAPHPFSGRFWCSQGHEKGLHYDPESTDTDSWGWPVEVAPGTKGAIQCGCDFDDPADFYELSQVYLGAQYFAELAKDSGMATIIKSAGATHFVNLASGEEETLPMRHVPMEVADARLHGFVMDTQDGSYKWVNPDGFVYTWDASEGGVVCMGRSSKSIEELRTAQDAVGVMRSRIEALEAKWAQAKAAAADEDEDPADLAEAVDASLDSLRGEFDQITSAGDEHYQQADALLTAAETTVDELIENLGGTDADDDDEADKTPITEPVNAQAEGDTVSKKAVQDAAKAAKLPSAILDKLAETEDDTALSVLVNEIGTTMAAQAETIAKTAPLAQAGESYLRDLRTAVKAAYVRAKQLGKEQGVDTSSIDKMIELAGEDIDLLKSLLDEYDAEVGEKIKVAGGGVAVFRSSFPVDPHGPPSTGPAPQADKDADAPDETELTATRGRERTLVSRIHGGKPRH